MDPPERACVPTCSSKPHPRAPPPDPRFKPGPVFVTSRSLIKGRRSASAASALGLLDGSRWAQGVLRERLPFSDHLRERSHGHFEPGRNFPSEAEGGLEDPRSSSRSTRTASSRTRASGACASSWQEQSLDWFSSSRSSRPTLGSRRPGMKATVPPDVAPKSITTAGLVDNQQQACRSRGDSLAPQHASGRGGRGESRRCRSGHPPTLPRWSR